MYEIFAKLLKERGLKASDVSKATGIPQSTFSDWKSGRSNPKEEKLRKIADFLEVSSAYLRTGKQGDEEIQQQEYYLDDETVSIAENIATNPELRQLYEAQRGLDTDDLKAMYSMALALKRKSERLDSDDPA